MSSQYDVFISCKNQDDAGRPSRDFALAEEVYAALTAQGLQVFFSKVSLETLGVAAYKQAIDDALDASTVLVVVGTSAANLDSRWVRYEWDGFYNDILSGVKTQGQVFVYVDGVDVSELPRALRQTQCFQHDATSIEHLGRYIANALTRRDEVGSAKSLSQSIVLNRAQLEQMNRRGASPHRPGKKSTGPSGSRVATTVILLLLVAAGAAVTLMKKANDRRASFDGLQKRAPPPQEEQAEPPEPDVAAPDPQHVALRKHLDDAKAYAEAHPGQYALIIEKFEQVRASAAGTEIEQEAAALKTKYENQQQEKIGAVVTDLKIQCDSLFEQGDPAAAARLIRDYAGPWAEETREQRESLATVYEQQAQAVAAEQPPAEILAGLLDALLRQDFDAASGEIAAIGSAAPPGIGVDQWAGIRDLSVKVAEMPQLIRDSFQSDIGKEVTVYLKKGPEKLRIKGLGSRGVLAEKVLRSRGRIIGTARQPFTVADLSVREKYRRLGKYTAPERHIMRGLLAYAGEADDTARQFFQKSESELGLLLSERLESLLARQEAERAAKRKAAFEQEAAEAYKLILDAAGLSDLKDEDASLVSAIRQARFNRKQVEIIKRQHDWFIQKYGETDFAKTKSEEIRFLGFIRPGMPLTVDQEVLDRAMKQLDQDNPSGTMRPKITIEDDGIVLDLSKNEVSDLSALAGLPIKTLYLHMTMVEDLSPLKGMPLLGVDLSDSKVWDISPLKNAPLVWLNLNATRIGNNLWPLQGMKTLRHLHLRYTNPAVTDLSSLRGLELETLSIEGSQVYSLEPIYGMPLKTFDATPELTRCSIQEIERYWRSVGKPIQLRGYSSSP